MTFNETYSQVQNQAGSFPRNRRESSPQFISGPGRTIRPKPGIFLELLIRSYPMRNIQTKIASYLLAAPLSISLFACGGGSGGSDGLGLALAALNMDTPPTATQSEFLNRYADMAYESYSQAVTDAQALYTAVDTFSAAVNPTAGDLTNLKNLWVKARASYLLTEGFRFSGGPIDETSVLSCGDAGDYSGSDECEGLLNAWPLDEDAIENYINNTGSINFAGIYGAIGNTSYGTEGDPEKIVMTGYHPIEFLLWGKDNSGSPAGVNSVAGVRTVSDFSGSGNGPKRKAYLKAITAALVGHLTLIRDQWNPSTGAYRTTFLDQANTGDSVGKIFQGLGSFIAGEWGGERLTGSFGGDQEEEHSCFSDTTKADFYYDAQSVLNIWTGNYSIVKGVNISTGAGLSNILSGKSQGGIHGELIRSRDVFCINLSDTETADPNYTTVCPANSLTDRYDQIILSSNPGDSLYNENTILQNTQYLIGETLKRDFVNAANTLGIHVTP